MIKVKKLAAGLLATLLMFNSMTTFAAPEESALTEVQSEVKMSMFGCDYASAKIYMDIEKKLLLNPYALSENEATIAYAWRSILNNGVVDTDTMISTNEGFPLQLGGVMYHTFTGKLFDTGIIAIPSGLDISEIDEYVINFTYKQIQEYVSHNRELIDAEQKAYLGEGRRTDLDMTFYRNTEGKIVSLSNEDKYTFTKPGVYEFYCVRYTDSADKIEKKPGMVKIFKKLIVVS